MSFQTDHERVVAERIGRLREREGWSHRQLARLLAEQPGCEHVPHNGTRLIEEGSRHISLNELMGLKAVFGLSVAELVAPAEWLNQKKAQQLLERIKENEGELLAVLRDRIGIAAELTAFANSGSDVAEIVKQALAIEAGPISAASPVKVRVNRRDVVMPAAVLEGIIAAMGRAMWGPVNEVLKANGIEEE